MTVDVDESDVPDDTTEANDTTTGTAGDRNLKTEPDGSDESADDETTAPEDEADEAESDVSAPTATADTDTTTAESATTAGTPDSDDDGRDAAAADETQPASQATSD
jgi:hypothetical protein